MVHLLLVLLLVHLLLELLQALVLLQEEQHWAYRPVKTRHSVMLLITVIVLCQHTANSPP